MKKCTREYAGREIVPREIYESIANYPIYINLHNQLNNPIVGHIFRVLSRSNHKIFSINTQELKMIW